MGSWAGRWALGVKSEQAGDSREIFTFNLFASFPTKSADIWKKGIIAICLFQQVPPLPCAIPGSAWLCRAVSGPGTAEGTHWGEQEGERSPSPPRWDGPVPVAQSDAWRPQAMPCGGTGDPVHPISSSAGLSGEPAQPLSLSAREAPDSILLTVKNLK